MTNTEAKRIQNARVTKRGAALARELQPYLTSDACMPHVEKICSLIARLATTHHSYAEAECNRELRAFETRRVELIERRIAKLVSWLPDNAGSGEPLRAKFTGDPRGYTVRVVVADKAAGNTWGRDGEYGI
jgi:hypothetical protein